jgi:hypothetical protein
MTRLPLVPVVLLTFTSILVLATTYAQSPEWESAKSSHGS